eukprot:TRINITY_DN4771_c0_g1_i4.p1 TRINITY_DN4771_c0_g1~~TRINITY_DN4771_c0_g1_i4.p1  ORF type:complete len:253 (+),score=55.06 TRINITY_DN4771_c0_g1_i4:47-805(+)
MKSKVVIITSKAKNLEESPSRRRMATTAKKDSEVEVHLGSTESPYRTYYTYEEFMCDKLSEYLDELQFFRKKVNEAEKSIIKSFHCPKFGKATIRKNTVRSFTQANNRPKCNSNLNATAGHREGVERKSRMEEGSLRRRQPSDVRVRSKGRRQNYSVNQKCKESHNEKPRVRSSTETNYCPSAKSQQNNDKDNILKEKGEDPLLVKLIKRRKELRLAEQREHELLLKRGLNAILTDIDCTKTHFLQTTSATK